MEKTEIKKALYKQNPTAIMLNKDNGEYKYYTEIQHEDMPVTVDFRIPANEIGDTPFHSEMEAKHLIRWIVTP